MRAGNRGRCSVTNFLSVLVLKTKRRTWLCVVWNLFQSYWQALLERCFYRPCYCMGPQIRSFCTGTKTGQVGGHKKTMARKPLIYKRLRAIVHWMRREGDSLTAELLPGFPCVWDYNNRLILSNVKNFYQELIHLRQKRMPQNCHKYYEQLDSIVEPLSRQLWPVGRAQFVISNSEFIPKSISQYGRVISDGDDSLCFVAERTAFFSGVRTRATISGFHNKQHSRFIINCYLL